ncbi:hypothetical protein FE783_10820 [Paenibacillus mesophilus]|uniref:Ig-like domain-containing protein n=1 Tax=Paenibacillus mesophilus TaxID=2582849 RepID=UPI00110D821A|nr:Ig-like domain-containing protein [Paenibacillus mesophilus]TMV50049.1 hypothetical protein FE783_10820 [Paenibacillus mesophilus]
MSRTDEGFLTIVCPDDTGVAVFPEAVSIPARIDLTAKTNSTNIRIKFGSGQVILNWECITGELRIHDPMLGFSYGVGGKGKVPVNEFVRISWILDVDYMLLLVDGEVRAFSEDEPYMKVLKSGLPKAPESLVGICSAWGSAVTVKQLNVSKWGRDNGSVTPLALLLDKNNVFVKPNESFTLESRFFPHTARPYKIVWSVSDEKTLHIDRTTDEQITVTALKQGIATITCKDDSGKIAASCTVRCVVPNLRTNLNNLKPVNGDWSEDYIGLIGVGSGDCFMLSSNEAADFTYEADVCIEAGIAAALVFRSAPNASGFYCANIDISGFVKLWRPGKDIRVAHTEIKRNTYYHLKVSVSGDNIKVYLDGRMVIDAHDGTYRSGLLGLNIFYGTGLFQNVNYSEL